MAQAPISGVGGTTTIVTPAAPVAAAPAHYVDWPAIFAGAVVATAIGVVFAGFGAALGLTGLSPQEGEAAPRFALILVGLWALVTILASYGAGGYVAGRMRRRVESASSDEVSARDAIHGMVVWGLGVLIGAWVAASAVGGAVNAVGNVAAGAAQAAGAVAQGAGAAVAGAAGAAADAATGEGGLDLSGFNPIAAVANRLFVPAAGEPGATVTGAEVADAARSPVVQDVIAQVARTGELSDDDRALLASEIGRTTGLPEDQVEARIDQAVTQVTALRDEASQRVEQAAQAARDAADAARRAAILTGFLVAAGFAIALGAAMWGAGLGGRHRDENRLWGGFRSY